MTLDSAQIVTNMLYYSANPANLILLNYSFFLDLPRILAAAYMRIAYASYKSSGRIAKMRATQSATAIRFTRSAPTPRFEIGDRVIIDPHGEVGLIVGVRYGAPAYDVRVRGVSVRNVAPERLRLYSEPEGLAIPLLRAATLESRDFLF